MGPPGEYRRDETGDSAIFEDFEWLAGLMAEIDRQTGKARVDKAIPGSVQDEIDYLQDRIRVEEALRAVVIRPADVATIPAVSSADGAAVTSR
jgi:hypothetical protein